MDALEAVVKGLNETVASLKAMATQAKEKAIEADAQVKWAKAQKQELAEFEAILAEREVAVIEKEKSLKSVEDITAEKDKIEAAKAALDNDRQTFRRACSEQKALLDQQASDVQTERASLASGWKDLEKAKAEYKTRILEEITKQVKK